MATQSQLTERYRPQTINAFVGLDKPKRICNRIARNPHGAYLFVGPSGTGKSTMARALASEIGAEIQFIPSQECTVDRLRQVVERCYALPLFGSHSWVVLVDEADSMSKAAQDSLLSTLDNLPPDTIFIFTCNEIDKFQDRFLSRVLQVDFSSYRMSKEITEHLASIWQNEAPGATAPNLARIVKDSNNNIRGALMALEAELMLA